MRRALVLFALFSCASYQAANAQRALSQSVTLATGVTVARVCDQITQEGVDIASLDTRPLPASSAQYFADLSQVIARRVGTPAASPPRTVVYGALLLRDGSLRQQFPVQQSGSRALDGRIADALSRSLTDGSGAQTSPVIPDSLRVLITFGRHEDGSPFLASHTHCPAVAYPGNPPAVAPPSTSELPRSIIVRAVVSPAGRVDTATVRMDDASDDRMIAPAMAAISQMRFVPAEFDGAKVAERIEIVVPFAQGEGAEGPATR